MVGALAGGGVPGAGQEQLVGLQGVGGEVGVVHVGGEEGGLHGVGGEPGAAGELGPGGDEGVLGGPGRRLLEVGGLEEGGVPGVDVAGVPAHHRNKLEILVVVFSKFISVLQHCMAL